MLYILEVWRNESFKSLYRLINIQSKARTNTGPILYVLCIHGLGNLKLKLCGNNLYNTNMEETCQKMEQ